ncbi:MAG: TetR/AcrR family transcriptional regulator [Gammaproteobacteria bacterium]|nr:TetR/AcrR family transcriptional regulator [Gammaproteobacteria bacterium]
MAVHERAGRPLDHNKDKDIFAAAHELLFSKGPAGFSVEAVARLAKVSKVTIYSRYANREALIDAVIRQQANRMVESLSIEPANCVSIHGALTDFGVSLLTFLLSQEYQNFMRALSSNPDLSGDVMKNIYRSGPQCTLNKLASWMDNAQQRGLLKLTEPERSAELLLGMLMGLNIVRLMYGEPCQRAMQSIEHHVNWVVNAFLTMYEVG